MIDKLTPKFLDKSSDYKLVRKTSLIDALNIYVDVETGGEGTGGVIKPIKGNSGIPTSPFDEQFSEDVNYKAMYKKKQLSNEYEQSKAQSDR